MMYHAPSYLHHDPKEGPLRCMRKSFTRRGECTMIASLQVLADTVLISAHMVHITPSGTTHTPGPMDHAIMAGLKSPKCYESLVTIHPIL